MGEGLYFEYEVPEEMSEKVLAGATLTESGLLDALNQICMEKNAEVVWEFGGFPRVILLRRVS